MMDGLQRQLIAVKKYLTELQESFKIARFDRDGPLATTGDEAPK